MWVWNLKTTALRISARERAIELAFEGVHYWDLMRYGKDGSYAAQEIAKAQTGAKVKNGGMSTTKFAVDNFTSKKGLMQYPDTSDYAFRQCSVLRMPDGKAGR